MPQKRTPLFLHIPKTGGTSVCAALKVRKGDHPPIDHPRFKRNLEHAIAPYLFTVVRDPIDRACSLYYWFAGLTGAGHKRNNMALGELARQLGGPAQFWARIDIALLDEFANERMFKPQAWFLKGREAEFDQIIRYENLAQGWAQACEAIGIPEAKRTLPKLNASQRKTDPYADLASAGEEGIKALQRLGEWFADDFERYGYELRIA